MGLDALLSRLENDAVTPVTPAEVRDVTAKPAPALDCTPVTPVTPPEAVTPQARASLWLLHLPGADPVAVAFAPAVDHAGVLSAYPEAFAAEPMRDPPSVPVPADLAAMLDACIGIGLYADDDRAALPAMLALDPDGARGLIEAMHARIGRCRRCRHFARPGLSDPGYCCGNSLMPVVYGNLRALPADRGAGCPEYVEVAL